MAGTSGRSGHVARNSSEGLDMLLLNVLVAFLVVGVSLITQELRSEGLNKAAVAADLYLLESRLSSCRGTAIYTKDLEHGERLIVYSVAFAKSGAKSKYSQEGGTDAGLEASDFVFVENETQSFHVEPSEDGYKLKILDKPTGKIHSAISFNLRSYLDSPYSIGGVKLKDILTDPDCTVEDVSEDKNGTRIVFRLNSPKFKGVHGFVLCDPNNSWAIQSYKIINSKGTVTDCKVIYSSDESPGIPKEVVLRRGSGSFENPDFVQKFTFDIQELKLEVVPAVEFTLAHFDIPDPPRAKRFGVYGFLVAIFLLLAAMLFSWRVRKNLL